MKLIFECETELGRCDRDRVNGHFGDEACDWVALAHTTAALTGTKGLLRIEQRCYLRSLESAEEVKTQAWVKPEVSLEPIIGSPEETVRLSQRWHEQFVDRARRKLRENLLLPAPADATPILEGAQAQPGGHL